MRPSLVILGGLFITATFVGGTVLLKQQQHRLDAHPPETGNGSAVTAPSLESRAAEAFAKGNYQQARALYKELYPQVTTDQQKFRAVVLRIQACDDRLNAATAQAAMNSSTTQGAAGGRTSAAELAKLNPVSALAASEAAGPDRKIHEAPKPGEVREMTIKQLGNFNFDPEKDEKVPGDVGALDGMQVRLRGFMLPLTQAEKVTDFALVPSLYACCFGQPPGLQHIITVRCPKNKTISYVVDEVLVEGTLRVNVKREDNYTTSIFEMDCRSVRMAP